MGTATGPRSVYHPKKCRVPDEKFSEREDYGISAPFFDGTRNYCPPSGRKNCLLPKKSSFLVESSSFLMARPFLLRPKIFVAIIKLIKKLFARAHKQRWNELSRNKSKAIGLKGYSRYHLRQVANELSPLLNPIFN